MKQMQLTARSRSTRLPVWLFAIMLLSLSGAASAQVGPDVADPWQRTRDVYRQADWRNALRFATEAAQRDPDEPRYYLAIARIHFQLGNFVTAVWYYDVFLELTEELDIDFPDASSRSRARLERESARSNITDTEARIEQPTAHRQVREAFVERLEGGPAVDGTSGGAWGTFESLLRVGYAAPDLAELRQRFEDAARAEGMEIFENAAPGFPVLSAEAWRAQLVRFAEPSRRLPAPLPFEESATSENDDPEERSELLRQGYVHLITGQLAYLRQSYESASEHFTSAVEVDPENHLAWMGLMNALLAQRQTSARELRGAIQRMREHVDRRELLAFYEAAVEEQSGNPEAAAARLAAHWQQYLNASE